MLILLCHPLIIIPCVPFLGGGECPLPPSPSCMIVKVPKRVDIYTKIMIKSKFNVWEVWWFFIIFIFSNSARKPRQHLRSYFKGPKIDFLYVRKSHWNDLRSLAPSKCYLVVILQWLMYRPMSSAGPCILTHTV